MTDVARYTTFVAGLKPDPRDVIVGAIIGPTTPFAVELRMPPGGGTALPAIAHSCMYNGLNGPEVADPGVRLAELAHFARRGYTASVCNGNLGGVMTDMGQRMKALVGDTCLLQNIVMPPTCEVFDQRGAGETFVPACGGMITTDCWTLVDDPVTCPGGQHLRLDVTRTAAPPADTWTSLRCAI
jgi:hypothetical protein